MARRLSERGQAVVFAVVLAVALASLYGAIRLTQAPPVASKGIIRASLLVDGDGWTIAYADVPTTNNTAFHILLEAGDRLGFDVAWRPFAIPEGAFVTAINGTVNGFGGRWWQYWVNGAYGPVAADRMEIVDGDVVEWRFTASAEGSG
ncbi:MAG TPA: DUF4430 domain-containing protein [Thermoplasmata archaeon]|nr:DUF4430 domain-containing protein [Thermoplasmata archaeon]